MISCKDVSQEAHTYLDGEMTLPRRAELMVHLMVCKHCRRYLKNLRLTLKTLNESEILEAPGEPSEAEIDDIVARLKSADLN